VSFRPVERIDRWTGQAIELAVGAHHRIRLKRAGLLDQLDPPASGSLWAAGDPPPRAGNAFDVLIDGQQALPRIAEALTAARSHVHIAGWHVTAGFGLTRDARAVRLRDLLGELAERVDVRVLLWAGSPLPLFSPDRSAVRRVREQLVGGTRVQCALDTHERPMHCHHEKLVIVDDEVAFVGGIDLTSLGGDRFDSSDHEMRSRLGWHDVASRIRGPAVADVAAHFAVRWRETTGQSVATPTPTPPPAAGGVELQVVRTVPEKVYGALAHGDFRILESYTRALRSARELVYLESQFLWSAQIVELLAAKLRRPPSERFRVVVLLPAKPNNGADSTRGQLAALVRADDGAGRFLATTVSARTGELSGPVYVHAKVGVVDDAWLTLGSANLNEYSLFNDTEMNVVTCDPAVVRDTRLRLWSEHLERPREAVCADPTDVIDQLWRPIAEEQRRRLERGDALTHRLRELPGVSRRSMALRGPLDSLIVDG
jgi:phosphatidylserine/phosphatidylglycerophosphate/cardiolipin synthase-like enzyme